MNRLMRRNVEIMGCIFGIIFSAMYISPYENVITLSEAVLQLSGSYGVYNMGFSVSQLVTFFMKLLPVFLMEMYGGTIFYRHFCIASIFVFSRQTNRRLWYCRECLLLGIKCLCFVGCYLICALLLAFLRFHLVIDFWGICYTVIHWLLYSIYTFAMSILINIFSIYLGSSEAYTVGMVIQVSEIVLLNIMYQMIKVFTAFSYNNLLIWNPVSYLVIGWQYGENKLFEPMYFFTILMPVFAGIFFMGLWVVRKSEIIESNPEWGK